VKEQKEIHTGFVVVPQTSEVMPTVYDKFFVIYLTSSHHVGIASFHIITAGKWIFQEKERERDLGPM
jgi:hypothetical protein